MVLVVVVVVVGRLLLHVTFGQLGQGARAKGVLGQNGCTVKRDAHAKGVLGNEKGTFIQICAVYTL